MGKALVIKGADFSEKSPNEKLLCRKTYIGNGGNGTWYSIELVNLLNIKRFRIKITALSNVEDARKINDRDYFSLNARSTNKIPVGEAVDYYHIQTPNPWVDVDETYETNATLKWLMLSGQLSLTSKILIEVYKVE